MQVVVGGGLWGLEVSTGDDSGYLRKGRALRRLRGLEGRSRGRDSYMGELVSQLLLSLTHREPLVNYKLHFNTPS